MDGNFQLQRKSKGRDESEAFGVSAGQAFFPATRTYKAYLKDNDREDVKQVGLASCRVNRLLIECCQTQLACSGKVSRMGLRGGLEYGLSTSGVVSDTCARHSVFLPGATVDLRKGER